MRSRSRQEYVFFLIDIDAIDACSPAWAKGVNESSHAAEVRQADSSVRK